jgi:S1-C subfamily serine protease/thiol-disulfide isomerase/thioredoxin
MSISSEPDSYFLDSLPPLLDRPPLPVRRPSPPRRPIWVWLAAANGLLVIAFIVALVATSSKSQQADTHGTTESPALPTQPMAPPAQANQEKASPNSPIAPTTPAAPQAAGIAPPPARQRSRPELIETAIESVVLITTRDDANREIGLGTGFVIDRGGLVATNYHVVAHANEASVKFRDQSTRRVKGYRAFDPQRDLAILEIEQPPAALRALKLAGDESPPPGAEVMAIGHPAGFQFSTSDGVVSAVHVTAELPEGYRSQIRSPADQVWIQTTAAISGGNSGGPLLNIQGELIGVNTWVALGENLGFAAHVRHVRELQAQLQASATPLREVGRPEAALDELVQAYVREFRWFATRMQTAATDLERQELLKTKHPAAKFAARFFEVAEHERKSPVALRALSHLCEVCGHDDSQECNDWLRRATDRLLEDHVDAPNLAKLALMVSETPHAAARDFLRRLAEKSGNRTTQGLSCFLLAMRLTEDEAAGDDGRREALALFDRVEREYADVRVAGSALGEEAAEMAYVFKYLSVGQAAPEIVGKDVDIVDFKLSDFRGKVVLLDFWANWCPHCVRMYPHERQLLEKHSAEPFAIVGVNVDDRETLREVQDARQVTWRSWSDGPQGPIVRQWRVDGFPTLYLIDRQGVIRFKWSGARGEELDKAIEQLLAEAAAPAANAGQTKSGGQ